MKISLIVNALKARCPSFEGRVAAAAGFANLPETTTLPVPAAFVVPLSDDGDGPMTNNASRQELTEVFGVIAILDNTPDERGQTSGTDAVDTLRAELWRALLGWQPDPDLYNGIYYDGGALLKLDRAHLWWRYEFAATLEIVPSDGWQEDYLSELPAYTEMAVDVDVIDPTADPNQRYPGPDGRIEFETLFYPNADRLDIDFVLDASVLTYP